MVDKLIVVKASRQVQLARCKKQWGLTAAEISLRLKAQLPLIKKIKFADHVINNSGSIAKTKKQINQIWKKIVKEL